MVIRSIQVPRELLLDQGLTNSAKLIWICLEICRRNGQAMESPKLLEARTGYSRHTVLAALANLRERGWLRPIPVHGSVVMPDDLVLDSRLQASAKMLFGALQLTPQFRDGAGMCTHADLVTLTGMSANTVTRSLWLLGESGWIETQQKNKFSPVYFTLRNPMAEGRRAEALQAELRLTEDGFTGEQIMREYLSLLVDSDEYDDDASPAFLVNPYTGQEMQFDRYYPPAVAFEFQGPQHFGPTPRFPSERNAQRQQARDLLKLGICAARSITLVVLTYEDLSLERMLARVDGRLPLQDLEGHEPLVAYLERVSRAYRRKAREKVLTWEGKRRA